MHAVAAGNYTGEPIYATDIFQNVLERSATGMDRVRKIRSLAHDTAIEGFSDKVPNPKPQT